MASLPDASPLTKAMGATVRFGKIASGLFPFGQIHGTRFGGGSAVGPSSPRKRSRSLPLGESPRHVSRRATGGGSARDTVRRKGRQGRSEGGVVGRSAGGVSLLTKVAGVRRPLRRPRTVNGRARLPPSRRAVTRPPRWPLPSEPRRQTAPLRRHAASPPLLPRSRHRGRRGRAMVPGVCRILPPCGCTSLVAGPQGPPSPPMVPSSCPYPEGPRT